jgi:hypothetical protein
MNLLNITPLKLGAANATLAGTFNLMLSPEEFVAIDPG